MRLVRQWKMLPRETVDALSLGLFKDILLFYDCLENLRQGKPPLYFFLF